MRFKACWCTRRTDGYFYCGCVAISGLEEPHVEGVVQSLEVAVAGNTPKRKVHLFDTKIFTELVHCSYVQHCITIIFIWARFGSCGFTKRTPGTLATLRVTKTG